VAERSAAISATVIANNEEACIERCIRSVSFCDEVIVVDSMSTDRTAEIAAAMGARVVQREFRGYRDQKEFARTLAAGPWVLNLDADEEAGEGLGCELREAVAEGRHSAFSFPFRTYISGRRLRFGRFFLERHVRAFLKDAACYDPRKDTHERLLVEGTVGRLEHGFDHNSYTSFEDARRKSMFYAASAARTLAAADGDVGIVKVYGNPAWRLIKQCLLQMGVLDGPMGLKFAALSAQEAYIKYSVARALKSGRYGA
jgi:hypothetical protein